MKLFSTLYFLLFVFAASSPAALITLSDGQDSDGPAIQIEQAENRIVNRIEFVGNEKTSDPVLRKAVSLKEGKPFKHRLLVRSLRRLNELKLFEELSERDVAIKAEKEGDQLYVLITVKEKEQQ